MKTQRKINAFPQSFVVKPYLLLLTVIVCTAFVTSCEKGVYSPDPPAPIDTLNGVIQIQYDLNQREFLKSIYTFPGAPINNKIEFYRLDSLFSGGNFTSSLRNHTIYNFDPVTRHLVHSSSRMVELVGRDSLPSNRNGNWDNAFDYSTGQQYPEHINITNYNNYLENNPVHQVFSHNPFFFSPGDIVFDRTPGTPISFEIILNDGGAVHLIDKDVPDNGYLFQNTIPGFPLGDDDQYWYFSDSKNNCREFLYQNGYTKVVPRGQFSAIDVFTPGAELKSVFTYDDNTNELKRILGNILQSTDVYWNRIAVSRSAETYQKEPFYYSQKTCKSYTDSLFTIDDKNVRHFYSAHTYRNEISKDQKGRIISVKFKNDMGNLIEEFDFTYLK